MKILIVAPRFPVLSETFVIEQVFALIEAGAQVEVLALEGGDSEVLKRSRFPFAIQTLRARGMTGIAKICALVEFALRAPLTRAGRRSLQAALRAACTGAPGAVLAIALMSNSGLHMRAEVILAHFGQTGVVAQHLRDAGLLTGALATVFHGFDVTIRSVISRFRPQYETLFRNSDLCLPVSRFFGERLAGWGCDRSRIHVSRMGLNPSEFPFELRQLRQGPLELLLVGRLTEKKGIEYAIRAMKLVTPSARLTIVGGGELDGSLRNLVSHLGLADRVIFAGRCSHVEVRRMLNRAHVFLLPSVTAANGDMEGIPVALMEAMAVGAVVISTRHSGIPELIENGHSGFLVDERDVVALAKVICELAGSVHDVATMARNARAVVEAAFNSRKEAQALVERFVALSSKPNGK